VGGESGRACAHTTKRSRALPATRLPPLLFPPAPSAGESPPLLLARAARSPMRVRVNVAAAGALPRCALRARPGPASVDAGRSGCVLAAVRRRCCQSRPAEWAHQ
jgi:hypothetical protein